ncbi:Dam family site-specific DNA-(adenine-N6)-methyltransferase [Lachnospiraceae bacterium WCA-9-b2]|jgi:DNA adenine methylase (dam)|uniref:Site-specific DNA-methyltransferase (adenine-specific) n=1 Tax=Sporofaciens musculi TaxID=2681861 RepID=A0A7X3MFI5_9FIRM|nr:Dam family site-specific DNA-(adenine-N6)-methyltransferase [Sporofaciens musculi]MCI8362963.1 Dam family site-specific DNA-(adenine-N6)-methyltransferase [Clostridia bacterium]MXP75468.1 Dam family site-specific DNA-(adenine-N6)-methyltransferase [Sporofaciens musculi]
MFKPVIKWSGSKRSQADMIKTFLPENYGTYFEPFLGGGSILYAITPLNAVCGDICTPLIDLWNEIKNHPDELAEAYKVRWSRLQEEGYPVYYEIRDVFNREHKPEDLLFLSRTCVNGLIRFNANGEFNNSLHHTRPGIAPNSLEKIIKDWSKHIQNTKFVAQQYFETTSEAKEGDLIYLDPPYFHTKGRYYGSIDYKTFLTYLESLNRKGIKYMLSFDGIRGEDNYTVDLPKDLYKRHEFIPSGNSSFKKVMNKQNLQVFESLYLNW